MSDEWLRALEELRPCLNGLGSNVLVVLHFNFEGVSTDTTISVEHFEVRTESGVDVAVRSERARCGGGHANADDTVVKAFVVVPALWALVGVDGETCRTDKNAVVSETPTFGFCGGDNSGTLSGPQFLPAFERCR